MLIDETFDLSYKSEWKPCQVFLVAGFPLSLLSVYHASPFCSAELLPTVYLMSKVCPNCLLPLWEALQDQQMCLSHVALKLLLLPWVLEYVIFIVHLYEQSVYPSNFSQNKSYWTQKPGILGAHFPGAEHSGWGAWCESWIHCSLGRTYSIIIIFPFLGQLSGCVCLDYTVSMPLLPILWFLLYIVICTSSFLLIFNNSQR